jgi:hypothetical protein
MMNLLKTIKEKVYLQQVTNLVPTIFGRKTGVLIQSIKVSLVLQENILVKVFKSNYRINFYQLIALLTRAILIIKNLSIQIKGLTLFITNDL